VSFTSYQDYKSTYIDWLEKIPHHWELKPLKYCITRLGSGGTPETKQPDYWADEEDIDALPWVSIGDMSSTEVVLQTQKKITQKGLASKGLEVFRAGSLLYSIYASLGKVSTLGVDAAFNQAILAIEPDLEKTTQGFLCYWLRSLEAHLDYYASSNTQANLNAAKVLSYPVALPRHEEQQAIASFLDRETAKIDALIAEQRRLIELIQEKRQAVISHAVTKGLNPNAPMKDSGVEWLGEVPEHWSVIGIKRLVEVKDGTHATPEYVEPGPASFPLITSKDFINNRIYFEDAKHISAADHAEIFKRSNTEECEVLMSMIGGNIGKAVIVSDDREFSIKNVALFKTRGISEISRFLLYYLCSGLLEVQIDLLSRGGAQGFLGLGDIRNLVLAKMPNDEMKAIVATLDHQTAALNRLVTEAKQGISLLEERRSALISAAVTGQIDVRGLVPETGEQ
jgi:restriction endonuclease S subunit